MGTIAKNMGAPVTAYASAINLRPPRGLRKNQLDLYTRNGMKHFDPGPSDSAAFFRRGRRSTDPNLDEAMDFNFAP